MESSPKFLDPQTLARIKSLELQARRVIEGFISGAHKSPFQGISVEFSEHREYVPGDDVRHIDWKVFGKTDKYYLKQYEQETNLVCNLVLDASESMAYGSGAGSKLLYASQIAASLAHLVLGQQDSVGMVLFDTAIRHHLPPSSQPAHLKHILHLLATCQPPQGRGQVGATLDELAGRLRQRSLVIVLSDLFDEVPRLVTGLRHLDYQRHEVVVFQVLDPAEVDFPFEEITQFRGLEQFPEVLVEPRGLRRAYQEEFGRFLKEVMVACRSAGVDYQLVRTDQPLGQFLATFLATRRAR